MKDNIAAFKYDSLDWGLGSIDPNERTLSGRKLNYCLQNLKNVTGKVLEVGCARGQFIRSLKQSRSEMEAYGCDINVDAIHANITQNEDGVHYYIGSAESLPFDDNSFDAVIVFDLIEHLENPDRFIAEVHRILKKDGIFHGYIPCEGQPGTLHWILWKIKVGHDLKRKHRGHIQRFSLKSCVQLFKPDDFDVLKSQRSGYFIEQFLDLVFYMLLETGLAREEICDVQSKKSDYSPAHVSKKTFKTRALTVLRDAAFFLGYWEGRILSFIPWALGLHVTVKKK